MKQLDPRLTEPALVNYGFAACEITTPEGDVVPGMLGRVNKDDDGNVEFFEATRVFPAQFKGEDVLVDYPEMKTPFLLYFRKKDGTFKTKKKRGPVHTATLNEDPRKVFTYHMLAFPEEAIAKMKEETATAIRELEARQVEDYLNREK